MSKPETLETNQSADPFTTEELVGIIACAGPGSRLRVEAHHLASGRKKIGWTSWNTEFVKGPAVIFYKEDDPSYVSGVLPLGGQTIFVGPPHINSHGDNRVIAPLLDGQNRSFSITKPIDPFTQENYRFELVEESE